MTRIFAIASDEWRYWSRSRLALSVMLTGLALMIASVILTGERMAGIAEERDRDTGFAAAGE